MGDRGKGLARSVGGVEMSCHPIAASNFPYPFDFIVKGITTREILRHQMINNVPSTYMEKVEIEVQWRNSEYTRLCTDCMKPLPLVGFVAKNADHWHTDTFHMECVNVERADKIVRVMVNARMKRKSQRYPNRIQVVEFIGYADQLPAYKWILSEAGYPVVEESAHV